MGEGAADAARVCPIRVYLLCLDASVEGFPQVEEVSVVLNHAGELELAGPLDAVDVEIGELGLSSGDERDDTVIVFSSSSSSSSLFNSSNS